VSEFHEQAAAAMAGLAAAVQQGLAQQQVGGQSESKLAAAAAAAAMAGLAAAVQQGLAQQQVGGHFYSNHSQSSS
jgi:hypothetical protein